MRPSKACRPNESRKASVATCLQGILRDVSQVWSSPHADFYHILDWLLEGDLEQLLLGGQNLLLILLHACCHGPRKETLIQAARSCSIRAEATATCRTCLNNHVFLIKWEPASSICSPVPGRLNRKGTGLLHQCQSSDDYFTEPVASKAEILENVRFSQMLLCGNRSLNSLCLAEYNLKSPPPERMLEPCHPLHACSRTQIALLLLQEISSRN